jgi:hypothetical protein
VSGDSSGGATGPHYNMRRSKYCRQPTSGEFTVRADSNNTTETERIVVSQLVKARIVERLTAFCKAFGNEAGVVSNVRIKKRLALRESLSRCTEKSLDLGLNPRIARIPVVDLVSHGGNILDN